VNQLVSTQPVLSWSKTQKKQTNIHQTIHQLSLMSNHSQNVHVSEKGFFPLFSNLLRDITHPSQKNKKIDYLLSHSFSDPYGKVRQITELEHTTSQKGLSKTWCSSKNLLLNEFQIPNGKTISYLFPMRMNL
jgi:hypothetical protein